MSNSASLSAAKRRRGGGPPVGQPPGAPGTQIPQVPPQMNGGLPPGLPPNFRQMPPQLQQQIMRQMQQRMMQQQQQQPQHHPQTMPVPGVGVAMSSNNMNEKMPPQVSGNGPYVVNSVLHNRAISEIDGIHIRDLPMSSSGLPCLPSGAALPPNILFKLHHDELLNQDAVMNEHSNRLQMLTNRLDKIDRGGALVSSGGNDQSSDTQTKIDTNSLANNTDFIAKILDNILTNTNLSDIINQIEPLQKENESLRMLIHSQQTTLNELSTLVMKLLNGSSIPHADKFNVKYEDIKDEFCNYVNGVGSQVETGETIKATEEIHNINLHDDTQHEQDNQYEQYEEDEQDEDEEPEHQHIEEYNTNTAREV